MKRIVIAAAVVCWVAVVAAGLGRLWTYSMTPGPAAHAKTRWPAHSRLQRVPGRNTLVLLLHPQCECSAATLGELARVMAHAPQNALTAHVAIYQPSDQAPAWGGTSLRDAARAIPGVQVWTDLDGTEARRFGAYVSGQTFFYDTNGTLSFSGGITFARGHSGDSEGRTAIEALMRGEEPLTRRTPVFGCIIGRI